MWYRTNTGERLINLENGNIIMLNGKQISFHIPHEITDTFETEREAKEAFEKLSVLLTGEVYIKAESNDVELSNEEILELKRLYYRDYKFIARDKKGDITAFNDKNLKNIVKGDAIWTNSGEYTELSKDLFTFIRWEDEKPTSIESLLEGYEEGR